MRRTQVYLGDDELELLDRAARATGASRSELIRRAIRRTHGTVSKADKLRALEANAGTWSDRPLALQDQRRQLAEPRNRGDARWRITLATPVKPDARQPRVTGPQRVHLQSVTHVHAGRR